MAKKAPKNAMPRRTFLRNTALATAAAGSFAAYLIYEQPWRVPYQHWYDKRLRGKRGRQFTHPAFLREYDPPEKTKTLFEQQFEKMRSRFKTNLSVIYHEGKRFTEFPASESVFQEFEQHARNTTQRFFSWLCIENDAPSLGFNLLTPLTQLSQTPDALHCYVVGTLEEGTVARYQGVFTDDKEGGAEISYMKRSGGHLQNIERMFFAGKDIGFTFEREEAPQAIIAAAADPVWSYTSVPAEALHYLIRAVRRDHELEDLNAWWFQSGKPSRVSGKQMSLFAEEWIYREEGVVHALLDAFLERQQRKEKFNRSDMQDYIHVSATPPYHYVPRIRALLKTTTPARLLNEYRVNPRALFARLSP